MNKCKHWKRNALYTCEKIPNTNCGCDGRDEGRCRYFTADQEGDEPTEMTAKEIRSFESGATRDECDSKPDFEGFIAPVCLEAYGEYMHGHRVQADGGIRESDNWQKGMGLETYMKSLLRHVFDLWAMHRGHERKDRKDGHVLTIPEVCSAIVFNTWGYLFETITKKEQK